MDSSESESGDICGIIEADGLTLEELPALSQGLRLGISGLFMFCSESRLRSLILDDLSIS